LMSRLLERCGVLKEMLDSGTAYTSSGEPVALRSHIALHHAESLYETVRRARPAVVLEVGMAFGVSSLAILAALHEASADGRLVSIDPAQTSVWKGCGRTMVARAGFSDHHEVLEDYDYKALPELLATGLRCDLAYIDGWHTFDHAFLDWWYIDKMLAVGGVVGLNDCGWPAVDKVIGFMRTHRKFTEIDVGLPPVYVGYGPAQELRRRLALRRKDRWYRQSQDRYFRKDADWAPRWDFFAPF
jgi:predicted O-methyltransferase YrrM